jgi:nitroreductase
MRFDPERERPVPLTYRELLRRRRVTRVYLPEPVDPAALERIVAVIRRAPSAGYAQGQRLVVITSEDRRRQLGEVLKGGNYDDPAFVRWMATAPVHIAVCTIEDDYHRRYLQPERLIAGREIDWPTPYWWIDAGGVAVLLFLAALDEGLAAGIYQIPPRYMDAFRDFLGVPDEVEVASVITVGHPATPQEPDRSSRVTWPRKPLEELVHRERWSS